jgi:hypothetical protein
MSTCTGCSNVTYNVMYTCVAAIYLCMLCLGNWRALVLSTDLASCMHVAQEHSCEALLTAQLAHTVKAASAAQLIVLCAKALRVVSVRLQYFWLAKHTIKHTSCSLQSQPLCWASSMQIIHQGRKSSARLLRALSICTECCCALVSSLCCC